MTRPRSSYQLSLAHCVSLFFENQIRKGGGQFRTCWPKTVFWSKTLFCGLSVKFHYVFPWRAGGCTRSPFTKKIHEIVPILQAPFKVLKSKLSYQGLYASSYIRGWQIVSFVIRVSNCYGDVNRTIYLILIGPECNNGLLVGLTHDKAEVQKYIQILGSANTFFTCYFGMDRLQWGVKVGGEGGSTELEVWNKKIVKMYLCELGILNSKYDE